MKILKKRKTFTLIELLIVIAIIGILASLLLPALQQARASVKTAVCKSNLKQIHLAFANYVNDYDEWVPLVMYHFNANGQKEWHENREGILKYLHLKNDDNLETIGVLRCPSNKRGWGTTSTSNVGNYAMNYYMGYSSDLAHAPYRKISSFSKPSLTLVYSDSGKRSDDNRTQYILKGEDGIVYIGVNSARVNYSAFLHLNNSLMNIGFLDGHVGKKTPAQYKNDTNDNQLILEKLDAATAEP